MLASGLTGRPGERSDPARRGGPAGEPEEDHDTIHDQIREGQSAGDAGSADSVSLYIAADSVSADLYNLMLMLNRKKFDFMTFIQLKV